MQPREAEGAARRPAADRARARARPRAGGVAVDRAAAGEELDPALRGAHAHREGRVLGHLRRAAEAGLVGCTIEDSTAALKIFPESTTALTNRGEAWRRKGDPKRALADYGEAIRIDPDNPGAYVNRAVIREDQGDRQGAIDDYKRAIAAKPRKGKFVNLEEFYQLAREGLARLSKR